MANLIKPMQLACSQVVLEQDNRFHYIVSATMGVRLATGESLLEFDFFKEAFEHMGNSPLPDNGMPKPQAEYLVSGSFYSQRQEKVPAGEVVVRLGKHEKRLFVFGKREWVMGIPSEPEPVTQVPLSWSNAYGGNGYAYNPSGIGFNDTRLPSIENPEHLLTSDNQQISPAGLSPLDSSWPQRMQYQGTYDTRYMEKYFPGYPADHDWRFFMTAPEDQWQDEYFIGDESFELHNLHPEQHLIRGRLPGYTARCFLNQSKGGRTDFNELKLNLDTIWFFPATDLALLISRGGVEVEDDEATGISHVLLAYESAADSPRSHDYYHAALEKRLVSGDPLLNSLNTADLIPANAKCAMELLQERALEDGEESSPFADNLDAKVTSTQKLVDDKVEQAKAAAKDAIELPNNVSTEDQETIKHQVDIDQILKTPGETKPDKDLEDLNKKLETILPGITAGNAKKLDLKEFSFGKLDKITAVIDEFTEGKQAKAMEELEKAKKDLDEQTDDFMNKMEDLPDQEKANMKSMLEGLHDQEMPEEPPMPRINLEELDQGMQQISPQITEAMQQLENMKAMGGEDASIRDMENMVSDMLKQHEADMNDLIQQAEPEFKELYIVGAHTLPKCNSPHREDHAVIVERLINRIRKKQDVSNTDWACLDLSGKILDGADFSGAYLEQVDFSNASLKGCNFKGAILARSVLSNADCSGANFNHANLGAVTAHKTDFTSAQFTETILSNSDFSHSIFLSSIFENVQALEIIIDGADFSRCNLEGFRFVKLKFTDTHFREAKLTGAVFIECDINGCNLTGANISNSIWANSNLVSMVFDRADLSASSFSSNDQEPITIEGLSFEESNLEKANFQKLTMPRSSFRKANICNANFSETEIKQADFSFSNAKQAIFRKAVLPHSNFDHANIMEGIMSKAYLSGASFRHANLYAVDFLRSTMGETDFAGANLDNTIIQDWQPS